MSLPYSEAVRFGFDINDLQWVSVVMNTADYCQTAATEVLRLYTWQ